MNTRAILLVLLLLPFCPGKAEAIEVPRYVDDTPASGLDHIYGGGFEYFVGGGLAVFDCNGDRYPDLYAAGGAGPAGLWQNVSGRGGPLRFVKRASPATDLEGVIGAYPLDVDSDAITDIVVLRLGENVVLKGLGQCRFENARSLLSFDGGNEWTTAFSAVFEKGETLATLFFGNYVDRSLPGAPFGTCHDNMLIRPAGDRYAAPLRLKPGFCALSALFSDWDRDGTPDLRISNDQHYYRGGAEQLYRFSSSAPPRAFTSSDGFRTLKIWGMGIASYDLDGDTLPEYFLTSMADNKLQKLADTRRGIALRPAYEDIAYKLGATLHRPYVEGETKPSTAWHAEFADVNNDGFVDLFVAKGNVEGMTDFAVKDPNNLALGLPGGAFRESAPEAGLVTFDRGRGAALADFNLDGLLDLAVVNRQAPMRVWRNTGRSGSPMGGWSMIELRQGGANPHAIGAWVEVRAATAIWRREVTSGGGHASGQSGFIHFGIGAAERVEVRVQWPDGEWGPWLRAFTNQFLRIDRGREVVRYWMPAEHASDE
jgi:hypothetical protein